MHYIGFLKNDLNVMMYFTSKTKPTRHTHGYFGKVLGPYDSEIDARNTMNVLKRGYGYRENPCRCNPLRRGKRKSNPGEQYHNTMFMRYLKESDKYKIGSPQYVATIAKAYEHLKSAQASVGSEPHFQNPVRRRRR